MKQIIRFHESIEKEIRIKVMGVGGGGCNAVDRMVASGFDDVEYVAANTDLPALMSNRSLERVQLGPKLTKGMGAGGDPNVGRDAAQESADELAEAVADCDVLFLAAGFGGGTGTGATPVIAQIARDLDILTIAFATKPFVFEGKKRASIAQRGLRELRDKGVAMLTIPNEKLLSVISASTSMLDAFSITDQFLVASVRSLYRIFSQSGLIHVDFADVRTVLSEKGFAVIGTGSGEGEGKVDLAVKQALTSPLLEKNELEGARGVLVHVAGGTNISLLEVNTAMRKVQEKADPEANIIFGATVDAALENKAFVTIIATGIEEGLLETQPRKEAVARPQKEAAPFSPARPAEPAGAGTASIAAGQKQIVLNFSPTEKGRFEKTEPTVYDGEDLDIPTFIRKKKVFYQVTEEEVR